MWTTILKQAYFAFADRVCGLAEVSAVDDVNVGAVDMFVRFLLAMALFSLATLLQGDWRWLALLGFVPLVTAAVRVCPIWAALGICTCAESRRLRAARLAH